MEFASKSLYYADMLKHPKAQKLVAWATATAANRVAASGSDIGFDESAAQLRDFLKTGLLKMTDLRDDPAWFFMAHRIIACYGTGIGQGFWTRFTVQFNLFAGTVLAVGNEEQVESLNNLQKNASLGCFGLTEKFAGVSSGMVVETIATYDAATKEFILKSPNEGAYKNWISQGFVADKAVVVADVHVDGKSHGAHAFLTDFRVEVNGKKEVVKGIRLADMGRKTVANDLDNAWIAFDDVRVPESALLNKWGGMRNGSYVSKQKGMHPMLQIGQRLFTGRVAVAQAANIFGRGLFAKTKKYTDSKKCWAPNGMRPPLSALPQLSSLFKMADEAFSYAERYTMTCEAELNKCLLANKMPPPALIEAIAVAKIRSVETTVQLCFRLKQTVGSFALMHGSGFEECDTMQIAKFAEGESFVLMQKLVRDRVKSKQKLENVTALEANIVADLQKTKPAQWLSKAEKIYELAELIMDRTMEKIVGEPLPKGIARPFATAPAASKL